MTTSSEIIAPLWVILAHSFEFLINFVSLFIAILSAKTVMKHRLFHYNLCLLINVMGVGWFILIVSRMVSLIQQFLSPEAILDNYILLKQWPFVVLEVCRICGCSLVVSAAILGIFERIFASILLDTYERKKHPWFVIFGLICSLPSTSVMAYFSFSVEYGYIVAIISGLIGILIFWTFVSVDRWNRKRLDRSIRLGLNYTLNQRFQLSENIRAASLIYRASVFGCFGAIIVVSLILLYKFIETQTQTIFNLYVAFYSMALILNFCLVPHVWRKDFLRQIRELCPRLMQRNRITSLLNKHGVITRARVQNMDGVQLEFSQDEEGQLYFQQLAAAWNT